MLPEPSLYAARMDDGGTSSQLCAGGGDATCSRPEHPRPASSLLVLAQSPPSARPLCLSFADLLLVFIASAISKECEHVWRTVPTSYSAPPLAISHLHSHSHSHSSHPNLCVSSLPQYSLQRNTGLSRARYFSRETLAVLAILAQYTLARSSIARQVRQGLYRQVFFVRGMTCAIEVLGRSVQYVSS